MTTPIDNDLLEEFPFMDLTAEITAEASSGLIHPEPCGFMDFPET